MIKKITILSICILVILSTLAFAKPIPEDFIIKQDNPLIFTIILFIPILLLIILTVAMCLIFDSANEKWWKALIPIYNTITFFSIIRLSLFWLLIYIIPIITILFIHSLFFLSLLIVSAIINVIIAIKLAKSFNKGIGFTIGLILLPIIFYLILGLTDSTYIYLNDIQKEEKIKLKIEDEMSETKNINERKKKIKEKTLEFEEQEEQEERKEQEEQEEQEEIDPKFYEPMDLSDIKPKSDFFQ